LAAGRAKLSRYKVGANLVAYCAFDILVADTRNVMVEPLVRRKERLRKLLAYKPDQVLAVSHIVAEGEWLFQQVLSLHLEGIVAKRLDSVYVLGAKTADWLKIKRKGHANGWHRPV